MRAENPQTSEINQEILKREAQLKEARNSLEKINSVNNNSGKNPNNSNSNDKFPTGWVVGGGILAIIGLFIVLVYSKNNKKKKLNK